MHGSCNDHKVGTLQLLNQLFGPGHGTLRKYFRGRSLRSTKSSRVTFIDMRYGAAANHPIYHIAVGSLFSK